MERERERERGARGHIKKRLQLGNALLLEGPEGSKNGTERTERRKMRRWLLMSFYASIGGQSFSPFLVFYERCFSGICGRRILGDTVKVEEVRNRP